jgi:hypothetical protein
MDGGIKFDVSANTAKFDADMGRVANSAQTAGEKIKQAFSGLGGILAGGAVLAGLKTLMNDFDRVGKLATRFGDSAESIQRVGVAAKVAGTDVEQVASAMTKAGIAASKAVEGSESMAELFRRAGINARDFASANIDQKLLLIAQAYRDAGDDAQKTNAIIEIMGSRAGGNLIPLISNVEALRKEMEGVAVVSDDMVRKLEAANDRFTRMGNTAKVSIAGAIEQFVLLNERIGSILAKENGLMRMIDGVMKFTRGNVMPLYELMSTSRTIAEMEKIEARANAIVELTREGAFGLDATRNAELIADRTQQILDRTRGINRQIELAEDGTEKVLNLEKDKTAELERQTRIMELQEERRRSAIRSIEQEVALIEAKLTGNKALEASLREQADFQSALEKTGSFETASSFAAARAAERAAQEAGLSGGGGGGGGGGGRSSSPGSTMSNLDRLRAAAKTDPRARAELMRLQNEQSQGMARAGDLRERGFFGPAASAEIRAERRAEERADRIAARNAATDRFGGNNMGEAFRNFRDDMAKHGGGFAGSQKDFENWAKDQAKSERERQREEQRADGGSGAAGKTQSPEDKIYNWLTNTFFKDFQERLPQHAMS